MLARARRPWKSFPASGPIDHSRNTITYHKALCLSLQSFALSLSSVSLGSWTGPTRNWKQCLCKLWGNKQRALWYVMVFSGVVNYLADAAWSIKNFGRKRSRLTSHKQSVSKCVVFLYPICYKDQLRDLIKVDSSPVVSKLSLFINWLFTREALGLCTRRRWEGERKGDPSPFFLLVIPFVKEPVLVFHAEY